MELCVLGSGSGGNASLVRLGGRCVLIDAGLGPRTVANRLAGTGVTLDDIDALLITHFDGDHFRNTWFPVIRRRGLRLYAHRGQLHALHRNEAIGGVDAHVLGREGLLHVFDDEPFELGGANGSGGAGGDGPGATGSTGAGGCVRVRPMRNVHDSGHSIGYRVEAGTGVLSYATDVGRVERGLIDAMVDADVIAIESNYDPPMQLRSSRPMVLKKRIMGGRGHLSNAEAFGAVARAVERSARPPRHVVLLHLSRQCNDPAVARGVFERHAAIGPRVCVTNQYRRTDWLRVDAEAAPLAGEQMSLGFG